MTESEYNDKLLCYWCSYGALVTSYVNKLKIGNVCKDTFCKLKYLLGLLKIYTAYDVRDFSEETNVYNSITESDLIKIMLKIETLI